MKFIKKNKLLSVTLILTIIVTLFSLIEMVSINSKYINQSTITFKVNNIRNPQVKKLIRFIDNVYGDIYFKISAKQKKNFRVNEVLYKNLPDKIFIEGIGDNYTSSNNLSKNNLHEWHRSHGNHSSNRFSDLKKINLDNVNNLELAWSHQFKDKGGIQANPIYANGLVYMPSTGKSIIAINAITGDKVWEQKTTSNPAYRGLVYSDEEVPKLYFCDGKYLSALYANTGKKVNNFGNSGQTKLKSLCKITPAIIKDQIIIATVEPALEVYNINSGELLWKYYLKEKVSSRHGGKRYDYQGGNPWGGISADIERELVFVTTGNPSLYFQGVNRPGKNRFSNCFRYKKSKSIMGFSRNRT